MKKSEIKVGKHYVAKVSDQLATVRIDAENPRGGWDATNLRTGKAVRIKSAQRLRSETRAPGQTKKADDAPATDKDDMSLSIQRRVAAQTAAKVASKVLGIPVGVVTSKKAPRAAKGADVGAGSKKSPKPAKERKPSGLDAAAKVLAEAGEALNTKTMVERMLAKGLWKTGGKTPAATIYAAILRECATKGDKSRFRKVERGKFTLAK